MCVCVCVCVCVRACVCVCACKNRRESQPYVVALSWSSASFTSGMVLIEQNASKSGNLRLVTLLMCLRVYVSGRSRGRRMGRECESEIFTYLFYIYCHFKCIFLSPCVKGKIIIIMLCILMK